MLEVLILTPQQCLFRGPARQVILPGEQGIFEVGPFHRPLLSRLLPGVISVDHMAFPIRRGVVKVEKDTVISLVETEEPGHGS